MNQNLESYYRLHAGIYDLTRWSFLFGRDAVIDRLARTTAPRRILEVGCGTGKNLLKLARTFPRARITGLDLSAEMLAQARKKTRDLAERIELLQKPYAGSLAPGDFDLVLFSYCLSMINPGWERAIDAAQADLCPGGRIGVADFHDSPVPAFRAWMGIHHVRMEGHLLPCLRERFLPEEARVRSGYGGLWRYLIFIGKKAAPNGA